MEQGIVLESVWVAVGFVVFIALVWRKAGGAIGAMLDERSEKISSELKILLQNMIPLASAPRSSGRKRFAVPIAQIKISFRRFVGAISIGIKSSA